MLTHHRAHTLFGGGEPLSSNEETTETQRENWREDSPYGLRRFGEEFITVGRVALCCHRKKHPPSLLDREWGETAPDAIYYNFLHGIELGLKAFLRHVDAVPLRELRLQFGHNVDRLLEEALQHNLWQHCPDLTLAHICTIRLASPLYSSSQLGYPRIGGVSMPDIACVCKAARALRSGLRSLDMSPAPNE